MAKRTGRGYLTYRAYVFKDKDPVIDELRTLAQQKFGGKLNHKVLRTINDDGGPSVSCMAGWFFKDTKRPFSASTEAAGRALGFRRVWRRM